MEDSLPYIGAVNLGRLIHLRIHAHDGRQVHDRAVSHILPDVEEQQDKGPCAAPCVEGELLPAQRHDQLVQEAVVGAEDVEGHNADDNPGNKVRQEHEGLADLPEMLPVDFGQEHRNRNLHGGAHHNEHQIVENRVPDNQRRLPGAEKELKILKPVPRRTPYAPAHVVLFKGQHDARHGIIGEQAGICDCRKQQQQINTVFI